MNWYLKVLKQYADFNGRARRKEYWMFFLINMIISYALAFFPLLIDLPELAIVSTLYSLALFLPSIAVGVRRLHDVGKSGWFFLIVLIPLIGAIWLLVLFCTDGDQGPNKWGVNPKIPNTELDDIGVKEVQ